jgi:hypothetical protein
MHVVQDLAETVWKAFVDQTPQGNIFHTPEMFRVFAQTKGHQSTLWAVVNDSGCPLALLLPVEVTLMDGLLRQLTTRAIAYGSVLCTPNAEGQQALNLLLQTYKRETKNKVLFSELRNLFDMSDIQTILTEQDFTFEGHLNYLIDLNHPAEEVLQSIGVGQLLTNDILMAPEFARERLSDDGYVGLAGLGRAPVHEPETKQIGVFGT